MNIATIHYVDSLSRDKIGTSIQSILTDNTAIVCVGTDKCIIDSLGPLVGTFLKEMEINIDVYGTLDDPVHALNIPSKLEEIYNKDYDRIIAIDACLSAKSSQGTIEIRKDSVSPGKGVGKTLPKIGDYSIIGVVDTTGKDFNDLIESSHLSLLYNMARTIAIGIYIADCTKKKLTKLVSLS